MEYFKFLDYRPLLKEGLLSRKQQFTSLTFQEMASRCRVHKAYLSKVLAGNGHLSSDQLFHACEYLGMDNAERQYAQILYEYVRSVSKERKRHLQKEINDLKARASATEAHIEANRPRAHSTANHSIENEYYLDPNFQIVHMLLTIERYSADMSAIAKVLKITEQELAGIIHRLIQQGVVVFRSGRYSVVRDMLHLSQGDPIFLAHNRLLRLRCIERLAMTQDPQPYSFSATISADIAAFEAIRSDFLKLIKKAQKNVGAAPQQRVFQLNFDLFSWDG